MKVKLFCLCVILPLLIASCSTVERKLAANILTFEYVGDDCSQYEQDVDGLAKVKRLFDFTDKPLNEIKAMAIAEIQSGDYSNTRRLSLLNAISLLEIYVDEDIKIDIAPNDVRLGLSEFVDAAIDAYTLVCLAG